MQKGGGLGWTGTCQYLFRIADCEFSIARHTLRFSVLNLVLSILSLASQIFGLRFLVLDLVLPILDLVSCGRRSKVRPYSYLHQMGNPSFTLEKWAVETCGTHQQPAFVLRGPILAAVARVAVLSETIPRPWLPPDSFYYKQCQKGSCTWLLGHSLHFCLLWFSG